MRCSAWRRRHHRTLTASCCTVTPSSGWTCMQSRLRWSSSGSRSRYSATQSYKVLMCLHKRWRCCWHTAKVGELVVLDGRRRVSRHLSAKVAIEQRELLHGSIIHVLRSAECRPGFPNLLLVSYFLQLAGQLKNPERTGRPVSFPYRTVCNASLTGSKENMRLSEFLQGILLFAKMFLDNQCARYALFCHHHFTKMAYAYQLLI